MPDETLVSVLINNYNYGRYLSAAIESALNQTYPNIEVIVVDDGSTDDSHQVLASYASRVVSIIKQNGGQGSAFNAGYAACQGDIICFLDSDDLFLPHKVEHVVQVFQQNAQIGWCFDRVKEFDSSNDEISSPQTTPASTGLWDVRQAIARGKTPIIPTATSGLSFRRAILSLMLPMSEQIRITSDGYIKFVALGLSAGWMCSETLSMQRIHENNAYTRRKVGRDHIMALTGWVTGIALYEDFPVLRRLAITLLSRGLGLYLATAGSLRNDYRRTIQPFLRQLDLPTRTEVLVRAFYWWGRRLLAGFRRS